jgi:effector-binding domain-containing protein
MLAVTETGMDGCGLSIPRVVERGAEPYLAIAASGPMTALPSFGPPKLGELHTWMSGRGIKPTGPGFFRYRRFDNEGNVSLEAGTPVAAGPDGAGEVIADVLPAGRYGAATYTGPYDRLYDAFLMLNGWLRGRGLELEGRPGEPGCQLEIYRVTPMDETDPSRLVTELLIRLAGPRVEKR